MKGLALLPLASLTALALTAGSARADTTYSDPTGDVIATSPDLAPLTPDLTTITVSNTADGRITFQITIASPAVLDPLSAFGVFFNIDKNVITGDDGDDAQAFFDASGAVDFERWNGSEMVDVPETNMSSSFGGGVLTFTVPRSELENTTSFEFRVASLVLSDAGFGADVAPNDASYLTYDLTSLAPPSLSGTKPTGAPARPRAGKRFTVTSVVTRDDTGGFVTSGAVTCLVRIGSARLRATGRLTATGAHCTMTVPMKAKGKTLKGSMTVRSEGAAVKRTFSFRVV